MKIIDLFSFDIFSSLTKKKILEEIGEKEAPEYGKIELNFHNGKIVDILKLERYR